MATATKGPWHVNAMSRDRRILGDASVTIGVEAYLIANHNATVAKVYRSADAALIANAPDLRDALTALVARWEDTFPLGNANELELVQARQVLARIS